MNILSIPYNNELKKVQFETLRFNTLSLKTIPAPYFKDYSNHSDPAYRNYKTYDKFGFREQLLKELSISLKDTVLKLIVLSPPDNASSHDAFAYLAGKEIVPVRFYEDENFKKWMDIIFERNYEGLKKDKEDGLFEQQPELNPNPQFMLVLGKGQFSQTTVNSGMMVDERPYENTGAYLHKKAPQQYNEAKIKREKDNYIKKYTNTGGSGLDAEHIGKAFENYILNKALSPIPPADNETLYLEFEKIAGYPFPDDLKAVLKHHNGIPGTGFLAAKEVLTEWKNWKTIYDDWMLVDLNGNNQPDGLKTLGIYTNPYWLPFLSTGGGNFIALDFAPGSKGSSGQIIAFGADEQKIRFITKDIAEFLEALSRDDAILNKGFQKGK